MANVSAPLAPPPAWRLRTYPKLLLAAVGVAFVFVVLAGDGSSTASGRVGGDYPAFYAAGTLIAEGRSDDLYSPSAQAEVQADLLGGDDGYLAFAYAPHVAAAYAPLAVLPYRTSYVIHTLLMVAALVGGLRLLRPLLPVVDRWFWLVLAATAMSYPMFVALGGGQNTALTFLLLTLTWRALADDRETLAGLAAGLLLFRPQYALPLIGLLLLARHGRAVGTAAAVGGVVYLANAAVLGWGWIATWLDRVGPFLETDAEVNAANSVSAVGFLQAVVGVDSRLATGVGGLATLAVAAVLARAWWRPRIDLAARMALTATGLILLSPHAMFYDAGLVTVTVLVLVDRELLSWQAAAAVWALGFVHVAKSALGVTLFAPVVMVVFVACVVLLQPTTTDTRALQAGAR